MGNNPSEFKGKNLPVGKINWNDAVAFCEELNKKEEEKRMGVCFAYGGGGSMPVVQARLRLIPSEIQLHLMTPTTIGMVETKVSKSDLTVPIRGAFLICMEMYGNGRQIFTVLIREAQLSIRVGQVKARTGSFEVVLGELMSHACVQPPVTTTPPSDRTAEASVSPSSSWTKIFSLFNRSPTRFLRMHHPCPGRLQGQSSMRTPITNMTILRPRRQTPCQKATLEKGLNHLDF